MKSKSRGSNLGAVPMKWVFDDGGRVAAGYVRPSNVDCAVRAVAIATGQSYDFVHHALVGGPKYDRGAIGVAKDCWKGFLREFGWLWTPTMGIGTGCRVHLRDGELPQGRLVVSCSRHLVAVVDGVIHDTYDPSRNGTRCVYGYYREKTRELSPWLGECRSKHSQECSHRRWRAKREGRQPNALREAASTGRQGPTLIRRPKARGDEADPRSGFDSRTALRG